jgi:hypothetical protein
LFSACSRTEQVLNRITSAAARSADSSNPRRRRLATTISLSSTFIWQPTVST